MKNKPLIKGLKFGFLSMLLFFLFSDFMFKNVLSITWTKAAIAALPLSLFCGVIMFLVVWRTQSVPENELAQNIQQLTLAELRMKDTLCEGKNSSINLQN